METMCSDCSGTRTCPVRAAESVMRRAAELSGSGRSDKCVPRPAVSRCSLEAAHLAAESPQSPAAVQGQSRGLAALGVRLHQDGGLQPRAALHRSTAHVQHAGDE